MTVKLTVYDPACLITLCVSFRIAQYDLVLIHCALSDCEGLTILA
jgi:hypothetical protein